MEPLKNTKTLQPNDTSNRILTQAMRMFLEKGYHGTSIDDITQAAALTKGAFYWHFKSKEDLLKTIVGEYEKRFLDILINTVDGLKGGALDKLEKLTRYNAAFAYYNPELCVSFTTLAAELVGAHHGIEAEIKRIYDKYQKFLSKLILEGKREKIIKEEIDTDLTALTIMAFHDGILLHWFMNKDNINGKKLAKTYKRIALEGLMV